MRLAACAGLKRKIDSGELDVGRIFFADEKNFVIGQAGRKSARNFRIWGDVALKKRDLAAEDGVRTKKQGGVSVMIALGVCANGIGALHFCEKGVKTNKENYLELLQKTYHPDMEELIGDGYTFQQDGASSHTAKVVLDWIKHEGGFPLQPWAPNSPDLNPLDYGIWGMIEPEVSAGKPDAELELRVAIRKAFKTSDANKVRGTCLAFAKRLEMCIAAGGNQFEYKM